MVKRVLIKLQVRPQRYLTPLHEDVILYSSSNVSFCELLSSRSDHAYVILQLATLQFLPWLAPGRSAVTGAK